MSHILPVGGAPRTSSETFLSLISPVSILPPAVCLRIPSQAAAIHLLFIAAGSKAINRLSNYSELLTLKSLIL